MLCCDLEAPSLPLFVDSHFRFGLGFFPTECELPFTDPRCHYFHIVLHLFLIVFCCPHPLLLSHPPSPHKKNPKVHPVDVAQGDEPDEQKQRSRKDRKGKKNKNKRDKGSEGKGGRRGKGKGKKGSRKKKHEENQLEDGFLRVSTALPISPSQDPFLPAELPQIQKGLETMIPAEAFGKFFTETPTQELQSGTEAPTEVPESEASEEVDELTCRPPPPVPTLHFAALTDCSC